MGPSQHHNDTVKLPPELRRKFAGLERRLRRTETARSIAIAVMGLAGSLLLLFVSDRAWDTPQAVRVLLALAGLFTVLTSLSWWIARWVVRRRTLESMAVLVQGRYRRLGDTLLGIVELADEEKRPPGFSSALYEAAIDQVAKQAEPYDFEEAVPLKQVRWVVSIGGGLLGLVILLLVILPAATLNTLRRWVAPMAAIARHTLVELDGLTIRQVVPHGEPFTVAGRVRYHSFWKPTRGVARFEGQSGIVINAHEDAFEFQVPGQTQESRLRVSVGDAEQVIEIVPMYRPSLQTLTAMVEYPDYLQYPVRQETIANGTLTAVEGSRVSLEGRANRPLSAATWRFNNKSQEPLNVAKDTFRSAAVNLPPTGQINFDWRDSLGLTNASSWRLVVQSLKDAAPAPALLELPREVAVLESEMLELKATARDDFGVKELGLHWEVITDTPSTNAPPQIEYKAMASTPREKKLEETFSFNPALLQIPPDSVVELRAYATDYFPGREPSESFSHRVIVVGNERHAELVRQKLEALLARLEEVTRLEEKVSAATRETLTLSKEKFEGQEAADRAAKMAQEQAQAAKHLDELAKEGVKTLREAVRNPTFKDEKLREWAKNMQAMQQISSQKMQQAAGKLKNAQQSPADREQKLAEALEKEKEILNDLEKLQQNVNTGLDDMQAMTLAQRLRKLGGDEQSIRDELLKIVPEIIGLPPAEVPVRFQKAQTSLADNQGGTHQETTALQAELGRFYERTRRLNYGRVSEEMAKTRTSEEMERMGGLIRENISMEAAQDLAGWSKRFAEWADILEPKENSSQSSGKQEQGSQAEQLLNQLMAMLRLREGQVNLRERTRLLDRQRATVPDYRGNAKLLAGGQQKQIFSMYQATQENSLPELLPLMEDAFSSMKNVESLLQRPQTDQVTAQAHTKTIDTLTDVINLINEQTQPGQKGGNQQQQQPTAEEMAFLMQMMQQQGSNMGVAPGNTPGGNMAGGSTDKAGAPAAGDAAGKTGDERSVNRATGVTGSVPTEFREALQNYFNALEKEKN